MPFDEKMFDFIVKQYESHHQHLLDDMQEERTMERNVIIACGIFYSWLATRTDSGKTFLLITSCVPVVVVFLSLIRSNALLNGVRIKASFLRELEQYLFANAPENYTGPKGWEQFIVSGTTYSRKYDLSQKGFWYLLLMFTIIAGIFFLLRR
jgi:hypothetical protein